MSQQSISRSFNLTLTDLSFHLQKIEKAACQLNTITNNREECENIYSSLVSIFNTTSKLEFYNAFNRIAPYEEYQRCIAILSRIYSVIDIIYLTVPYLYNANPGNIIRTISENVRNCLHCNLNQFAWRRFS